MKILSVHLENFGSYETLDFDFQNQGLTLIQGATGSGKSTLCDAIPWVLFGKTAKGGAVDEVLSWPGDKVTKGSLCVKTRGFVLSIVRIRGKGKNDLYFEYEAGGLNIIDPNFISKNCARGKDLPDTQKLINEYLGLDLDLYLSGAYYHEFSQTAQFFTTTAKNRRQICEQIVDLSLPRSLQEKTTVKTKELKNKISETQTNIKSIQMSLQSMRKMETLEKTRHDEWFAKQAFKIQSIVNQSNRFEVDRTYNVELLSIKELEDLKIKSRSPVCSECGAPKKQSDKPTYSHYAALIEQEKTKKNPYKDQVLYVEAETNPHSAATKDFSEQIGEDEYHLEQLELKLKNISQDMSDLEILSDITGEFRSVLISNVITQVEDSTNKLLSDYFDAELRVCLNIQESDKLEVEITKDGNVASFTQLSKGQRQLLKLCFAVSVMRSVSNNSGVSFDNIFLDEVFEGLDGRFKMQALSLLEKLSTEYESVFFIEHSETIQAVVNNKYIVSLVNGRSEIIAV